MASHIGTSEQFSTAFMAPDPGEEGDAIWGRKIASNTGYLFHRPETIGVSSFRTFFTKRASHNGLRARLTPSQNPGSYQDNIYVWAEGQDADNTAIYTLVKTVTYNQVVGSHHQHDLDISSLNEGSTYVAQFAFGNGANVAAACLQLVWGTAAPK